ncbi:GEVED domain-containing protein [Flavobacterium sp.]|uniref:GEVED domain-containing protein n=1 Tax=Flavobacterium sp. TaxID=239 RepID=UPI0028BE6EA9|nr:GEVED domain-containing protein [Flavobacterium sp.]
MKKNNYSSKGILSIKNNLLSNLIVISICLLSTKALAQFPGNDNSPTLGTPRTFNVPANVTHVTATTWGGGGGGGGSSSNDDGGNGGGGGGATTYLNLPAPTGTMFTYTIGQGGNGGNSGGGTGGNGVLSTINGGSISLTANGGTGGRGNQQPLNLPTNSQGGSATGGTANNSGNNGALGGNSGGDGGDSGTISGVFGAGGNGNQNAVGDPGSNPGGGGGGGERGFGNTNRAGGAGASGRVTFNFISVSSISVAPVCIGETITITGTNFATSGSTTVTINGIPCTSVTVVNNTTITAVVAATTTNGTVIVSNPNGINDGHSLIINAAPNNPPNPTSDSPQCNPPGVTITQSGSASVGETWYWQTTANGTSTANEASTPWVVTASGTYYIRSFDGTCWSPGAGSRAVVVTPIATITTQPATPLPVCAGNGIATISVVASNALTYRWRLNGTNLNNGGVYAGTTTATLTITNPGIALNGGVYDVVINAGPCETISTTVILTVNPLPAITTQPVNTTICTVGTGNFSVVATGNGLTYQWRRGITNLSDNAVFSGTNSDILTITNPTTGDAANNYNVVVSNVEGCSVTSANRTLTVNVTPTINVQPVSPAPVCEGQGTRTITINATGVTSYRWRKNGVLLNNGAPYGGVTTATLTITNPTMVADDDYDIVLNAATCPVYSNTVHLTVNPLPVITVQPVNTTICSNATGGFSVTATGTGLTYQWRRGTTILNNDAIYSGTTSANLVITNPTAGTADNDYNVVVTNASGCTATTPNRTLIVTQAVTAVAGTPAPANNATGVCYGGYNALSLLNWGNVANATSYEVYFGAGALPGTPTATVTNSDYTIPAGTLLPNTTYYWQIIPLNSCGITSGTPITWSFTTASGVCYCSPSSGTLITAYISGITSVGTLNDVSNAPTGRSGGGFGNFTNITIATQIAGGGININIELTGSSGQFIIAFVDWNSDGDFADANEQVYTTGNIATDDTSFGFIVPLAQSIGNYRMRIRTRSFFESSTIDPCTTGYASGETEDYTIAVVPDCPSKITSVVNGEVCGSGNTVNLTAVGTGGTTEYRWYASDTAPTPLSVTPTGSWTTGVLASTTVFYVTAFNGTCESLTRTPVTATIKPTTNITFTPDNPILCGDNQVISINVSGDVATDELFFENFESGIGGFTVTTPTNTNGGSDSPWSVKTSTYAPNATTVWIPAINSGALGTIGNRFAFTTSDYQNSVLITRLSTSSNINTTGYSTLTLTFNQYYSYYGGDSGILQVSIDGGTNWTDVQTYNSDLGSASKFIETTADLTPYTNNASLRFRFTYNGTWDDGWAIDNIKLIGVRPLNTTFTWSGGSVSAFTDAACTNPYTNQPVTVIYIKPNPMQIELPSWNFTATTTLSNGCLASKSILITNNTKTWDGITTNWSDPNNWKPSGVPTIDNCVIIPSTSIISGANYNAYANNLTIKPTGSLEITSGNNLNVLNALDINPNGGFTIRNSGSLIQTNDVPNIGIMNMERLTQPLYRLDYTYWNSPVTTASNFQVGNLTSGTSNIYRYLPTQSNGNGTWQQISTATNMNPTTGIIARAPGSFPTTGPKQTYTVTFTGTPNNGDIFMPISKGTDANIGTSVGGAIITAADDEWNLIGNPYPSAIDIVSFLNHPTNIPVVDGTVYLWTHNTPPTAAAPDPFYGNFTYNYTASDYATVNYLGNTTTSTGGTVPSRYVAAGQSFFVSADDSMLNGSTQNVLFNNSMRVTGNNNNFLRMSEPSESLTSTDFNKQRIWLNLSNNNGGFSQILVGYAEGATQNWDRGFDGEALASNAVKLYSLGADKKLTIQGRPWPFDQNDLVPIGFKATAQGNYTIGIDHFDNQFNNQNIYLEDLNLNIIHDLKVAAYSFTSIAGEFENRFVLRYTNSTLGNDDVTALENSVIIYADVNLNIKSNVHLIKEIRIYDILGKLMLDSTKVNANEFKAVSLTSSQKTLIVNITLDNGAIVKRKVIF